MRISTLQAKLPPWQVNTFEHALNHAHKAAGQLSGAVDDMDHSLADLDRSAGAPFDAAELRSDRARCFPEVGSERFIADLVICAVKLAKEYPVGEFDLETAVLARLREKNPGTTL